MKKHYNYFSVLINQFYFLNKNVIELNNFNELKKVFNWENNPILDRVDINNFDYIEDVNFRRLHDAESIGTVINNINPQIALEIGTADGMGTVLMASNAPNAKIFTVNIPPEEIKSGKGGILTTIAIEKEKIGLVYKERKVQNITQIYANTATWKPNIGEIDFAFIDGCHDTNFVFNDTVKVLRNSAKDTFILWHDFNLELTKKYNWINAVCKGVEKLYRHGYLKGRMFHIKDSWVGIYRVSGDERK